MKTLTKVKLINWHTFSNTEFEIYKNALITGENGTGKSTILDAIQYVLTVGKCKFNKAASDIGNRTLESYIRCKTGIEGHEYVRNGDVTTYIVLEFFDENGVYVDINPKIGDADLREYLEDSMQYIFFLVELERILGKELPDEVLLYDNLSSLNGFANCIEALLSESTSEEENDR